MRAARGVAGGPIPHPELRVVVYGEDTILHIGCCEHDSFAPVHRTPNGLVVDHHMPMLR